MVLSTQAIKARHILRDTVRELVKETRQREAAGNLLNDPLATQYYLGYNKSLQLFVSFRVDQLSIFSMFSFWQYLKKGEQGARGVGLPKPAAL